jgi:uncharacterized SAM-binding protein YcdF (DUF218 family)
MHTVSTVVTTLISPLAFVLAFAAAGVLLAARRRVAGWIVLGLSLFLFLALSVEPGRDLVLRPLEDRFPALDLSHLPAFDAVVVLGAGSVDAAPDEAGGTALSREAARRATWGAALARLAGVPVIVSGGRSWERGGGDAESSAARRLLERLGVPAGSIIEEPSSRDTWENARLTLTLVPGGGTVALVTSAYHLPRAALAFEAAGIRFVPAPTDFRARRRPYDLISFLPSFRCLEESFQAIREYAGLAWYRLRRCRRRRGTRRRARAKALSRAAASQEGSSVRVPRSSSLSDLM